MLNYIKAEAYRLLHKKSTFYTYGALILAFIGLVFLSDIKDAKAFLAMGNTLVSVVLIVVMIQSFISVYSDDLGSRTYSSIISTGIARTKIVFAKAIVMVLNSLVIIAVLAAIYFGIFIAFGGNFGVDYAFGIESLSKYALNSYLYLYAQTLIASIIVFTIQSTAMSITGYVLLVMGFVGQLFSLLWLAFPAFKFLNEYLLTGAFTLLNHGEFSASFAVIAGCYIVVSLIISSLLFNKKEITV